MIVDAPDAPPEADRAEGAPHPRETKHLFGQSDAEATFLDAYAQGRLHHAWLLSGPMGIGKATLAWRIARFLLADPGGHPSTLDLSADDPVLRRTRAMSEPRLHLLRRSWDDKTKRLKSQLTVDEVRKVKERAALSSADGGRRVVIVDSADELNTSAANAFLKLLEEPPERMVLLLISHQPSRLLPTIRSRCRTLRLQSLASDDLTAALKQAGVSVPQDKAAALAELADGSVGRALRVMQLGGLDLYADLIGLLGTAPKLDRSRVLRLAEAVTKRGQEDMLDLFLSLLDTGLARIARTGATGAPPQTQAAPQESTVLARVSPNPATGRRWAQFAQDTQVRTRHARAVNIDPAGMVADALLRLEDVRPA